MRALYILIYIACLANLKMPPLRQHLTRLTVLGGLCLCVLGAQAGEVTVSAASSLSNAFKDLKPLYEAAHPGSTVQFNFGASGALLAQASKGAPVDVLVSADQETMNQAQSQGLVAAEQRRDIATNTLVVVVPRSAAHTPKSTADLSTARYARIAIGLPASVPVGRYTKSVLEAEGRWAGIEPKMIGANTVRQALDYVARAEVDAGFVYATDAALMPDKVRVAFTVPTTRPVRYPAAALKAAPNPVEAQRFVAFLLQPAAQAVLAKYGFGKP